MLGSLFLSVATFRRGFWYKAAFVVLNLFDLLLTVLAFYFGLSEMNPIMRMALGVPLALVGLKVVLPVLIAWLAPGALLLPANLLLAFVVAWDCKELVLHFS